MAPESRQPENPKAPKTPLISGNSRHIIPKALALGPESTMLATHSPTVRFSGGEVDFTGARFSNEGGALRRRQVLRRGGALHRRHVLRQHGGPVLAEGLQQPAPVRQLVHATRRSAAARAVHLAVDRAAHHAEPELTSVQTWQATENEPMARVNAELGFRPDPGVVRVQDPAGGVGSLSSPVCPHDCVVTRHHTNLEGPAGSTHAGWDARAVPPAHRPGVSTMTPRPAAQSPQQCRQPPAHLVSAPAQQPRNPHRDWWAVICRHGGTESCSFVASSSTSGRAGPALWQSCRPARYFARVLPLIEVPAITRPGR
jgi:hypothetical protein